MILSAPITPRLGLAGPALDAAAAPYRWVIDTARDAALTLQTGLSHAQRVAMLQRLPALERGMEEIVARAARYRAALAAGVRPTDARMAEAVTQTIRAAETWPPRKRAIEAELYDVYERLPASAKPGSPRPEIAGLGVWPAWLLGLIAAAAVAATMIAASAWARIKEAEALRATYIAYAALRAQFDRLYERAIASGAAPPPAPAPPAPPGGSASAGGGWSADLTRVGGMGILAIVGIGLLFFASRGRAR